jgi:hypothetical protein
MSNDRSATRDAARFVALEREASRLLDLAIETDDPHEELRLIREARKLRAQMVSAA